MNPKIAAILDKAGIENRSLIATGARVLVFDKHTELLDKMEKLSHEQEIEKDHHPGKGEFLGDWDYRQKGRDRYREVIQAELAKDEAGETVRLQRDQLLDFLNEAEAYSKANTTETSYSQGYNLKQKNGTPQ